MRITTLFRNYCSYVVLLFFLGNSFSVYSQCPTIANASQTFCDTQSPTVGDLVATDTGGGVRWFSASTGGSPLSSTTALNDGVTYYVDNIAQTCSPRIGVSVTIFTKPFSFTGGTTFCSASTVADLAAFMIGNQIKWYTTPTGGTALASSTPLISNTVYYASQTNPSTGCETSRRNFVVVIKIVPTPTTSDNTPTFCSNQGATVADLQATGTGISWYSTSTSGIPLDPTTPLVAGQDYFAESYDFPCNSNSRLQVTVNFDSPNNAGSNDAEQICIDQVPLISPTDLFDLLGGTPDLTGVWTGPLPTLNGHQGTLDVTQLTLAGSPYVFTYTVSTSANCPPALATVTIVVNPLPTVTVDSPTVCSGTLATVTATPTPAGTYNYTWIVPSGATDPGNVASFTTSVSGTYSVVITNPITSCSSTSASGIVTINPLPSVIVSNSAICAGATATVTATPTPAGTYNYVWTVPVGVPAPGSVASFTTTIAGTYSVIITDTTTTCPSPSASGTVTVSPIPTVTVNSPIICAGAIATITATPSPVGTYNYAWTVPLGVPAPGNVASFTSTVAGIYSVIVTNTITNCVSASASGTVTVNPIPTVTVNSSIICTGATATVTATPIPAGTYNYVWTVPVGVPAPGNVASFTTTVAGTYSVVITDTTTTCPSPSASGTVTVNPIPAVTVNSSTICAGDTATVTAVSTPSGTYNYSWTVPVGVPAPGNVASFTTTIAGIYSVIITDTTTTCPSPSASGTVTVNTIPTVTVNSPNICAGANATITATPSPVGTYNYSWTVPLGVPAPGNVASFTTTVAGTYSVIVTSTTTNCGSTSASGIVTVNPIPTVTVNSSTICTGTTATLTATPTPSGTYSYVWAVPVGVTNPGNVASFATTVAGNYSVIITDTTTTCPSPSATGTVTVNPSPTVIVNSSIICTGVVATVTATPTPAGAYNYTWTVPVGVPAPGNVASFTTTIAGTYSVVITDTITTCPSPSASGTVTVNPIPTVTVNSPTICTGASTSITATPTPAGTYNYVWTVPVGVPAPGNVASFTTTVAGNYSVIATNTITNCGSSNATGTVTISPLPTVTVNSSTICAGTTATVTATPNPVGTYNYVWAVPVGVPLPGNVSSFTTSIAGTYSVIITNTTTNCTSTSASGTVIINPLPTVSVNSPTICEGSTATITATPTPAGTYSYAWSVPVGVPDPGNVVSFTTTVAGTYSVIITDTTTTCPSPSASGTMTVNPVPNAGDDTILPLCSNQNPVDLFPYLGPNAQPGGTWSPALASGTSILNPAVDPQATYTYTVAGTSPCADDQASIVVTITPGPEAGTDNTYSICANSIPHDLFLELGPNAQPGGVWSPAMASGTGVFDPSVDTATAYTYTLSGTNPCDNDFAVITVIVNPVPDAGIGTSPTICTNAPQVDLFTFLNGTPQLGGTWSPALASGTGVFNPAVDTGQTYTYTVGGAGCTPATADVVVTLLQSPIAGIDGNLTSCPIETSLDLTSGLDGTQGAGTWNDDDATGALIGNIFNPSTVGVGIYHFTYTVGGGTAPCLFDTAVITVTVNPMPNAGTAVTIPSACASVGTVDLDTLLTGQDATGVWTDSSNTVVTSPVDVSAFVGGTYSYTYTVTNSCGSDFEPVQFDILPNPQITTANIAITPVCIASDVTVNLSGLVDGNYTINYDLSGANVASGQTVTLNVVGGNASFVIPTAIVPASGTTVITFISIQNTVTNCLTSLTNIAANIIINPIVQIDNTNITVANVCLASDAIVTISNATNLPDGTYQFAYTIPTGTPTTGNSGDVIIAGGNGQFNIPSSFFAAAGTYSITINSITTVTGCSNINEDATTTFNVVTPQFSGTFTGIVTICPSTGIIDLNTLLTGQSSGGVWTDSTSTVVTSPVTIINFAAGTYSYTYTVSNACGFSSTLVQFTVLQNPTLTTLNVTTPSICIGANGIVNFTGLIDGTYTIDYDLTGSNFLTGQSATVTITGGSGSFIIPNTSLPNTGITVITFNKITNTATNCFNLISFGSQLVVKPLADIDSPNLSIASVCFGNSIVVSINSATNLPDDTYQFNYSIPGATPTSGNSGNVIITGGTGQFTIPASVFTTAGSFTLTVFGIVATTGCTNVNENASANFVISPIPDLTGAVVSTQDTCLNFDSTVTITAGAGLPDGLYIFNYQISGVNTGSGSATITFTSGVGTFTIPGSLLTNEGATVLSLIDITNELFCTVTLPTGTDFTFNVSSLDAPTLVTNGNIFCLTDIPTPTVANLTANIVGGQAVIWYDAPTGGNILSETDLLVEGTIYYAAAVAPSGCESASRLQVTADFSGCPKIKIPDGFSPNDDGINDTFEITNLESIYPNFKLEIYNRYGNVVYKGNINTPRWGGTTTESGLNLGSDLLPTGVYFYILYYNDGITSPTQGRVYLSR